tara:strand:- start:65 stop:667 length:603 start_codon:yes stop_codon:yes gene_type:complete
MLPTLTETDTMVRRAQLVNSLFCCFALFILSCENNRPNLILQAEELDLRNNVVNYLGKPFTGLVYDFFEDSSDTLWVKSYKNGLKDGFWRKYYSNGDLREKRFFVSGKKEGEFVGYFRGGVKNFVFSFDNGEYNGTNRIWTKKGLLIKESNFKGGYELGSQKTWYLNGKIKSNYIIKNERRYGLLGTKNCVNVFKNTTKI